MGHRLDRETAGIVLVAKTPSAFDDLRRQFRARAVKKREPASQIALITAGHADVSAGALATKGRLSDSKMADMFTGTTDGVSKLRASLFPRLTSTENGTRNFSDAASHKQNRSLAAFWLRNVTNTATTAANTVDCHR